MENPSPPDPAPRGPEGTIGRRRRKANHRGKALRWRWRRAASDGLSAEQAARAVGVPRSTLYRWEKEPKSRRPVRVRLKTWTPALRQAVERLRQDFPMWGRAKLGPLLRAQGFAVSDATVGRILAALVARGVVEPVPAAPGSLRPPLDGLAPLRPAPAERSRRERALRPGPARHRLRQSHPTKAIKHFTAYDPIAKWTVAKAFNRAAAQAAASFLDRVTADRPFPVKAIQVDGRSEFMAEFENRPPGQGDRPLRPPSALAADERRRRTMQRRLAL
jgi:putative transposase